MAHIESFERSWRYWNPYILQEKENDPSAMETISVVPGEVEHGASVWPPFPYP